MRFRKLSKIELEALSEELIQFLVVQGIDDDLWRDINKKSPEKAEELVALFSDTVLQKVYSKVKYLSFVSEQVFSIFKINGEEMEAIVVKNKSKTLAFKNFTLVKNPNQYEFSTIDGVKEDVADIIMNLKKTMLMIRPRNLMK